MMSELQNYMHFGWFVVPIHGVMVSRSGEMKCTCGKVDCSSPGKHPTTPNGLKSATVKKEFVDAWWKKWPWANVGIVTGALSGLVVVDIDPRHGGDDSLDDLFVKHGSFGDTVEAITGGGGRHFYFKHPGFDIRNSVEKLGRGIDVRGDGGYVLAPPSLHISGGQYGWEASSTPTETELAPMPQWLIDLLVKKEPAKDRVMTHGEPGASSIISSGGRDNFLTACAGAMRRWGMTYPAILSALQIDNDARCDPPLSDADIQRIAKSVMRYPQSMGV